MTPALILIASGALLIIGLYSLTASAPGNDPVFSFVAMILGGGGIATGVGMLLLRRWARLTTLVVSIVIGSWAFLAAPVILYYPIRTSTNDPEEAIAFARGALPIFLALLLAFALWCIYLLNTDVSKRSFGVPTMGRTVRPVSNDMIGGFLLVCAVLGVETIISHGPAMLFGSVFTGWKASAIWLSAAAVELYLGIGLLMVNPQSRVLAVFFFLFQLLETVAFLVRPDRELRIADYFHALQEYFQHRSGALVSLKDVSGSLQFWSIEWGILVLIALWYLFTSKKAFAADKT